MASWHVIVATLLFIFTMTVGGYWKFFGATFSSVVSDTTPFIEIDTENKLKEIPVFHDTLQYLIERSLTTQVGIAPDTNSSILVVNVVDRHYGWILPHWNKMVIHAKFEKRVFVITMDKESSVVAQHERMAHFPYNIDDGNYTNYHNATTSVVINRILPSGLGMLKFRVVLA